MQPELLEEAEIGLPPSMRLAQQFRAAGMELPTALTPEEMAASIAQSSFTASDKLHQQVRQTSVQETSEASQQESSNMERTIEAQEAVPPNDLYRNMDPRLKWLLYILLVTAAMLQHRWIGLSLILVPVVLALSILPRQTLAGCVKLMKPLLLFFIISTALSGTTLNTEAGVYASVFPCSRRRQHS